MGYSWPVQIDLKGKIDFSLYVNIFVQIDFSLFVNIAEQIDIKGRIDFCKKKKRSETLSRNFITSQIEAEL